MPLAWTDYQNTILVPPDVDVSLNTLAHELAHVLQYLEAVEAKASFEERYRAAHQRGLKRPSSFPQYKGREDKFAYIYNTYEMQARRTAKQTVKAYTDAGGT